MPRVRNAVDHRPGNHSSQRDLHLPRWLLALLALGILSGVVLLFTWLESKDPSHQVVGRPAELGPDTQEPARARPPLELDLDMEAPPEAPPAPPPDRAAGPILSLEAIGEAERPEALRGRTALLDGVRVLRVVGDYTFWIGGEGEAPRLPVVLRGELMGRQPEGRVEVRAGQRVRVLGTLQRLEGIETTGDSPTLDAGEREELRQAPLYLGAERVEILDRGAGDGGEK